MAKRVIRCPIDWLTFAKGDIDAVMTSQQVRNHAILNYTVPPKYIEPYLHRRFRCETFTAASGQEQALVTVSACTFQPQSTSVLQRWIDTPLLSSVSYQVLVRDQVTWQRSSWQFATFLRSFFFSRIPRTVYGLPLFHVPVQIETQFNVDHNKYDSYSIHCEGTVDGIGTLEIDLNDTGVQLLHPKTRILDGFDHNESALATLAYNNEYVTRGEGNWLYRQTVLGNPFHPNRAELKATPRIDYLVRTLGLPITLNEPHSIFLQDDVGTIYPLQLEAHIEDDNEPHSGSQMPGASGPSGGIHDRIQRKAMNRYTSFRDDLRSKILTEKKDNPETEPHRTPPS